MADKLEREIEEIISKTGDLPPPPKSVRRTVRRAPRPEQRRGMSVTPGYVLMASVALLLVGVMVWNASSGLGTMLMLAAIILFIACYALYFNRRSGGPGGYEKRWRGQVVPEDPPPSPGERLRAWWSRFRR